MRYLWILVLVFFLITPSMLAGRSLVYFYTPSCGSCLQTRELLSEIQTTYPDLEIFDYNLTDPGVQVWLEEYGERYGVSEEYIGIVPAIFYGDKALTGYPEIRRYLTEYLLTELETPAPDALEQTAGKEKIVSRFKSFSSGTIIFAGLVDGVNPCAFSTLIFFISFLVVTGQKGRKILYVGASFTLGIFLSYLLLGWGLFQLVTVLQSLTRLARWVYPVTAVLVTILALISLQDYWKVTRGNASKMKLTLPKAVVRLINKTVQKLMKMRYLIPVAFVAGILISLLEFLCTGQIYLPTIVYITGVPYLRAKALYFLVLYNLSFVLPMVIIFVIAYKTNTSRKVSEYLHTRLSGIKLALTGLFALLAIYMWILTCKFF